MVSVSVCEVGHPGSSLVRSACYRKVRFYQHVIDFSPPVLMTGSPKAVHMCYHVCMIIHVKDPQLSVVRVGHRVPLAGFCLSLYGLHVLNRVVNMIQTKTACREVLYASQFPFSAIFNACVYSCSSCRRFQAIYHTGRVLCPGRRLPSLYIVCLCRTGALMCLNEFKYIYQSTQCVNDNAATTVYLPSPQFQSYLQLVGYPSRVVGLQHIELVHTFPFCIYCEKECYPSMLHFVSMLVEARMLWFPKTAGSINKV